MLPAGSVILERACETYMSWTSYQLSLLRNLKGKKRKKEVAWHVVGRTVIDVLDNKIINFSVES